MPPSTEEIRQQLALTCTGPVPLAIPLPVTVPVPRIEIEDVVAMVEETVIIRPISLVSTNQGEIEQTATQFTTHKITPDANWSWRDLRDYVVNQIESRFGVFPRDDNKETGIFKSFMARYPDGMAAAIAKHAFEVKGGFWKGAPISVTRFCKGSDPYFGDLIKQYLLNIAAQ